MSRMSWWRWSAARLADCGFAQGTAGDEATSCGSCSRTISAVRIWRRVLSGQVFCRRCAVERTFEPRVSQLPEHLRSLRAMVLRLLEDGWTAKAAIRTESLRRLRIADWRISRREWRAAWSDAHGEFVRRQSRRRSRRYDGSSRFGWRPGR